MLQTKNEYNRAIQVVETVINQWDPYCLLEAGAPPDEFAAEVAAIVRNLHLIRSPQDAARVISEVFSHYFSPEDFPIDSCEDVGSKLYERLRREELIAGEPRRGA